MEAWILFAFLAGVSFGGLLALQAKRDHVIKTAPESDLLRELKRRRFERELKAKVEHDIAEELQGPRPAPPAPMNKRKD